MKMFLRILVILVIGGLFFLGGFLLGSKDPSSTMDTDALPTEAPKLDVALPGAKPDASPEEAKTDADPEKKPDEKKEADAGAESAGKEASAGPVELAKLPDAPKVPALPGAKPAEGKGEVVPTEKDTPPAEDTSAPEPAKEATQKESAEKKPAEQTGATPAPESALKTAMSIPDRMTYSIQVGTFLERELAEERAREFKSREYPTFVVSTWDSHRQLWHTVRVGNYTDLTEARLAAREIQEKERINAHVFGIGTIRFDELPVEEEPAAPSGDQPPKASPSPANNKEPANVP